MSRYYSLETIRDNAYDVTLANGAKHRCIDPDALLDIETADVIEVVRCKDCKYHEDGACAMNSFLLVGPNDYCSYSEKI